MELLKSLIKDLSFSLDENSNLSPGDHHILGMQICLFENIMEEFKSLEAERDSLKVKNKKIEEELKLSNQREAYGRNLQFKLDKLEEDNTQLTSKLVESQELIQSLKYEVSKLCKENRFLGKRPVDEVLTSLSMDKLKLAWRLSFLLQINEEKSIWLQFKKEKQWLQCSNCGIGNHSLSRCSLQNVRKSKYVRPTLQVFFQRSSDSPGVYKGRKLDVRSNSIEDVKCDATSMKQLSTDVYGRNGGDVDLEKVEMKSQTNPNCLDLKNFSRVNAMDEDIACKVLPINSTNPPEEASKSFSILMDKSSKTLVYKKTRSFGALRHQRGKSISKRSTPRSHIKPIDSFKSLLFPSKDRKRLKLSFPNIV